MTTGTGRETPIATDWRAPSPFVAVSDAEDTYSHRVLVVDVLVIQLLLVCLVGRHLQPAVETSAARLSERSERPESVKAPTHEHRRQYESWNEETCERYMQTWGITTQRHPDTLTQGIEASQNEEQRHSGTGHRSIST